MTHARKFIYHSLRLRIFLLVALGIAAVSLTVGVWATTTPASGTLSPANPVINFTGGPFQVSNPSSPTGDNPPVCTDQTCGQFALTVNIPASDTTKYNVKVSVGWTSSGTTTQGGTDSDYDLYIYQPDVTGAETSHGAGNTNPEVAIFPAANGAYTVYVVPYDVSPSVAFNGQISLVPVAAAPLPRPTPTPQPLPPGTPRFVNYTAPAGLGDDWGEPSIGVNWLTGKVLSYGGLSHYALSVSFDDCPSPARATWDRLDVVTASLPRAYGGDPILYTDKTTGRTLVSQLQFGTTTSNIDYTDNDGSTFQLSQGSGIASGFDHQTLGGGPFHAPLPTGTLYPNAVYYCGQSVAEANCALSVDGGRTFGPAVPIYAVSDCGGLHGHVKVAPDGTVYVPNKGCGGTDTVFHSDGTQSVIVSEDNGLTWAIRNVPNAHAAEYDPSVGIAKDGTVYFGYMQSNGHARIAVSRDRGRSWTDDQDVGAQVGVENSTFPAVVAGDGGTDTGRAAYAFFGTADAGAWNAADFPGVWYLYIATTFDGGKTWTTQSVTPGDPIQRGGICGSGTCRNLLDFFDAAIDREGRVLIGYDDGCTGPCVQGPPNTFSSKAVIARQSGGRRMFAQFDPRTPSVPLAPSVTATKDSTSSTTVHVAWSTPDDGGSGIVSYNIYRRAGTSGVYTLLTTVNGNTNTYDDAATLSSINYYYRVRAVNAIGEGAFCGDALAVVPPPAPDSCKLPGLMAVNDVEANGKDDDALPNVPQDARMNIKQLFVAEPASSDGTDKLVFTLQLAPATSGVPAASQWYIIWNSLQPDANFDRFYVAMKTDATGALSFEYGKFGVALDPTAPNPNANSPVKLGDADGGSYNPATGVLTITLSTSKAEGVQAGQALNGLNARTFFMQPDAGQKSQRTAADITSDGSYVLSGNGRCH